MLFSQLLQKNGVEITRQIQALIKKFGDRLISKQFQNDFVKRIQLLDEPILFGYKPHELDLPFSNMVSLDKIYCYRGSEFMEKYPKFEVLFLNIWCLIHASLYDWRNPRHDNLITMINDDDDIIGYHYHRKTCEDTVTIKFNGDSATVDIEHKSDNFPLIIIKIN
jgi:hypothetical protein